MVKLGLKEGRPVEVNSKLGEYCLCPHLSKATILAWYFPPLKVLELLLVVITPVFWSKVVRYEELVWFDETGISVRYVVQAVSPSFFTSTSYESKLEEILLQYLELTEKVKVGKFPE